MDKNNQEKAGDDRVKNGSKDVDIEALKQECIGLIENRFLKPPAGEMGKAFFDAVVVDLLKRKTT